MVVMLMLTGIGSERDGLPFTYVQGKPPPPISVSNTLNAAESHRDERPLGSISVYDAIPARGICVLFQFYRKYMSPLRPAHASGRTSRSQGQSQSRYTV